ncbi:MAG TPA: DNA recombination protein RmuC [Caulobacteraceae bacterium]
MNAPVAWFVATMICGLAAVGAAMWAMAERARAARAELKADLLAAQTAAGHETIKAQAALTANAVAAELVTRAADTFKAQDAHARTRLEAQLKPVADTLAKFEAQVSAAEVARAQETGGLKAQIEQLLAASTATQEEARKLSAALRRGAGVQGRWGEQMLLNTLEMAGLRAKTDFEEQFTVQGDGGALRPDVVVRLPGAGMFVIDAKCSLNAFLEAQDAPDEVLREAGYVRHAASVRTHMHALAAKAYWAQFERSPDFVVMFVPGEAFLAAAAERLPNLFTEAMERRVIVVTPSSLFALCKAVAYGWRVEEQTLNAKEIAVLGRDLYKRLSVMGDHLAGVGASLGTAVKRYNEFVGSLESQVLTQARKFEDLKVDHQGKDLPVIVPVDSAVRPLVKLAAPPAQGRPVLTELESAPTSAA